MDRTIITAEQRFFAPEVVQTSAMDCGPAALKCLLEGFGIAVSYGRLREACQTDVDGTSINTLEDVAQQLGLVAQQVLTPVDHLLLPAAQLLPALVVTVQPSGATHFVVVWRTVGRFVQVMDPATGRRWLSRKRFAQEIYRHQLWLPAATWRTWAGADGFCGPLRARLQELGVSAATTNQLLAEALAEPHWRTLAALDAATRLVTSVVGARGLARGTEATQLVERLFAQARQAPTTGDELIPAAFWMVQPLPSSPTNSAPSEELLLLRGAVLLQVSGRQPQPRQEDGARSFSETEISVSEETTPSSSTAAALDSPPTTLPLSPDLAAALAEPTGVHGTEPAWAIFQALRVDGLLTPGLLSVAIVMAALGVTLEAALFRGLMTVDGWLGQLEHRTLMAMGVLVFSLVLFLLEAPLAATVQRMGRRLETRLRIALLEKIPRLGDHYFHSRLISDMAHRAYSLRQLHSLPSLAVNFLRQGWQLVFTALCISLIAPASAPIAFVTTLFAIGAALLSQPLLAERDLRVRTHTSALSRFYLDALLGLTPIRAHSAERAVRREHEMLLVEWVRASWGVAQIEIVLQAVVALVGIGGATWIVLRYLAGNGEASSVLLLLYWALNLPALGQSLVGSAQQYPLVRNHVFRLLEPLGAPEESDKMIDDKMIDGRMIAGAVDHPVILPAPDDRPLHAVTPSPLGVAIQMTGVVVHAGGHTVLHELDLVVQPGEHIAIVGPSGAGKSSLVGLLLGWQRAAAGELLVDGAPLTGEHLQTLRRETAWVDPAVQLWNRPLAANLRYGLAEADETTSLDDVLLAANLYELLESLPDGLATTLGEGGGLVSGGEGQRVRLGRALLRPNVRLAILDEPFRGLDRQRRRQLFANARQHWQAITLLCITHDVSETQDFARVLVLEEGRIVEDGAPDILVTQPDSRYRALLAADTAIQQRVWTGASWRRLWLEQGQLRDT